MKKFIKSIIFLTILILIIIYIFYILWLDKTPASLFFEEAKNSLDVVYVGSSDSYYDFNSALAYNLYGYATGLLCTANQPFPIIKYFIKESQKYQNPVVYIIDLSKIELRCRDISNANIKKSVDSMNFLSENRFNAINEILKLKGDSTDIKTYIDYYLGISYHNRWNEINENSFKKFDKSLYKGYLFEDINLIIEPKEKIAWEKETMELNNESKDNLISLLEYIKSNNLQVLFIMPLMQYESESQARINNAIQIIRENGMNVINFNDIEEINLDYSKDFYNNIHLNVYGATKYTLYFSKYLKEKYNLKSHKGDPLYNSWETEYERFKADFVNLTNQEFEDLLVQNNI